LNKFTNPVEIEVDGSPVPFGVHASGSEYHIGGGEVRELVISSCMNTLRWHTAASFPNAKGDINLIIRLDAEKRWWEPDWADLYVEDRRTYFDIQFTINAAIGMQQAAVTDIVYSCINGSAFSIGSIEHEGHEIPFLPEDGWRGWDINLSVSSLATAKFHELLKIRSRISQEVFLPREALTVPFLILRTLQMGNADNIVGQTE
jgi:hypothetical protein